MAAAKKPLLIYDGDCAFCVRWIARGRTLTGDRVDYQPSATAASDHPEIRPDEFSHAVQWIAPDGSRASGAKAVFSALATVSVFGRLALTAYRTIPFFGRMSEALYQFVARHRSVFSRIG